MTVARTSRYAAVAVLTALVAWGCMKRNEAIKISRDGGVSLLVNYETDTPAELDAGDAMPSAEAGWKVNRSEVIENATSNGDPKTHYLLEAEKTFAPGDRLPGTFALSDADAALYLQFPTALRIERRPDGVYYHFRRTYAPRPEWGQIEARRQQIVESVAKGIDEKPSEQWTAEDRRHMVEASVRIELAKMTRFTRAAFDETTPEAPQDQWLKLHAVLTELQETVDCGHLADLLAKGDDETRTRAIEAEAKAFEARFMARITSTLSDACGYGPAQVAAFTDRYRWHERYHAISEGLGDDSFEITVEMPGEIVGSNANRMEDGKATWEFTGTDLCFQPVELMVTSRVAAN